MAESTLSVGFSQLVGEVGRFLGMGYKAYASYAASQQSIINQIVQSGVRRVYFPPAVNADIVGYEWSWLKPSTTLPLVVADYDYDLPDDFGRLTNTLNYSADSYLSPISIISVNKLLAMKAASDLSGNPTHAAVRFKASTGTTGQRQEILFYPKPSAVYTLSYEYEAYSGALSDAYPYPLGGMQLSELYIESCLAVAESRMKDEIGIHNQQFTALLVDAIKRDRKNGAHYFGQMGNKEVCTEEFRRASNNYTITYKGAYI